MADDLKAIEEVLQTYFDGLYEGSTEKLAAAFHDSADLRSVNADGSLAVLPKAAWLEGVRNRPSAASRNLLRRDFVISLDRSSSTTAFAKVNCQIPPRYFTDYLVLAKLQGGWKIVSKTFHTDTREG
ncbi:MAG: nuclear transport factor 2 family protein [Acetobacteraceae bacterium]|nr:nuclear transport factor 2 family protein [Acetobacteraceae bacterium]